MIGTTAALIMAGGAAASKIAGSKMQSSAAKKAAQDQQQATQRAQAYLQQGMGQLGQMYSPYINSALARQSTLSRLTIPGAGARFAAAPPPNATPMMPQGGAMPTGGRAPMQGPYMMAEGGDFMVNEPTMFIAGEAGPERASFSGAQPFQMPQGPPPMQPPPMQPPPQMPMWQGPMSAMAQGPMSMRQPMSRGMSNRAGALQGAMRGGPQAAGANAMRSPFGALYGG